MREDVHNKEKHNFEFTRYQMSQLVAIVLISTFLVFTLGYFLGKKRMLEEISQRSDITDFAEKIYQSVAGLQPESETNSEQVAHGESEEELCVAELPRTGKEQGNGPSIISYAQLCGFGNQQSADAYCISLKMRNIDTHVVERKSKSKKGRIVAWYQVVTEPMPKIELENIVEKVKKDDRLMDVKIIDLQADEA